MHKSPEMLQQLPLYTHTQ